MRTRNSGTTRFEITTNFDPQIVSIFKEVRNLTYLKFQVPHAINSVAKDAKRVYPYAMSLTNSLRIYSETSLSIEELGDASVLMNEYQNTVQSLIVAGMKLDWQSFAHAYDASTLLSYTPDNDKIATVHESSQIQFAKQLTNSVTILERKSTILIEIVQSVRRNFELLRDCAYTIGEFTTIIEDIQSAVDRLNYESFSNLNFWVAKLNDEVSAILLVRLRRAISDWINDFVSASSQKTRAGNKFVSIEIIIRNQTIFQSPPLEYARAYWFNEIQECISVLCQLRKLNSSRYELTLDTGFNSVKPDASWKTFGDLASLATNDIRSAYGVIEQKLDEVRTYTAKWFQFQSLWDLLPEKVFQELDNDLTKWISVLQEIRQVRTTFDTASSAQNFGNIVVDYEQVQSRINAKYDSWQHDILVRFGEILSKDMHKTHSELDYTRRELEVQTLDMLSTKRAIEFVTIVQRAKIERGKWIGSLDMFKTGQIALAKNRFQFPADWIFVEQINGEMSALNEILTVKNKIVTENLGKKSLHFLYKIY